MDNMTVLIETLSNVSTLTISPVLHAAQISSQVSKCTLGPNSELWTENDDDDRVSEANDSFYKKTPESTKEDSIKTPILPEINCNVLDCDVIKTNVKKKYIENQRTLEIRKELEFMRSKSKEHSGKLKEIEEKSINLRRSLFGEKVIAERRIIEECERFAQTSLNEAQKSLDAKFKAEKHKIRVITIDGIAKYQQRYNEIYSHICRILTSPDKVYIKSIEAYNMPLRETHTKFENLLLKIKNDSDHSDVECAENLWSYLKTKLSNLEEEIERNKNMKALEMQRKVNEEKQFTPPVVEAPAIASLPQAPAEKPIQDFREDQVDHQQPNKVAPPALEQQSQQSPSIYVTEERLKFYNQIYSFYARKVESVKPLQSNIQMKKYRFACQKAINTPINAISSVSPQHLQDKFDKLFNFMSGNPITTPEGSISTLDHPLGKDFCLLLLAKKFINQGDSMVSSNLQAAFPIASLIVAIWQKIPEFGNLFLAYTYKECPYLVPYFIPQTKGQSTEEYFKVLGYRIVEDVLEKQDMYLKRQSGIVRLYAAVMITPTRQNTGPHPFGIENGWMLLCNLMNLDPLPDICATVIFELLQIQGFELWNIYGHQFEKLLRVLQEQYFPKLSKVDEGGPKTRLEVFLSKVLKERRIEKPAGMLPENFW